MPRVGSIVITNRVEGFLDAKTRVVDFEESNAAALAAELKPYVKPEDGFTVEDVVRFLHKVADRWLGAIIEALSENEYRRQHLRNAKRSRSARVQEATVELKDLMVDIRFQLDRALGRAEATTYFEGRSNLSGVGAARLQRIGTKLLNVFSDPKFGLGALPDEARRVLMDTYRARLEEGLEKLRDALDLGRPERSALLLSNVEFEREYGAESRVRRPIYLIQGLLRAAGRLKEASQLVPKPRQRPAAPEEEPGKTTGMTGTVVTPPGPPTGTPPQGASPDASTPATPAEPSAPTTPAEPSAPTPRRRRRPNDGKALVPAVTTAS